jgi:WhiB family redox-sensing transcriptional regulator
MTAARWSPGVAGPLLKRASGHDWHDDGACNGTDPDLFFPAKGKNIAPAVKICARCPVRARCLDWALSCEAGESTDLRHGIYGGLGPRDRWAIDRTARKGQAA